MLLNFDQDLDRLTADWIAAADAFLLGRRTYDLFAGAGRTSPTPAIRARRG